LAILESADINVFSKRSEGTKACCGVGVDKQGEAYTTRTGTSAMKRVTKTNKLANKTNKRNRTKQVASKNAPGLVGHAGDRL
jgi:hypothetical protein